MAEMGIMTFHASQDTMNCDMEHSYIAYMSPTPCNSIVYSSVDQPMNATSGDVELDIDKFLSSVLPPDTVAITAPVRVRQTRKSKPAQIHGKISNLAIPIGTYTGIKSNLENGQLSREAFDCMANRSSQRTYVLTHHIPSNQTCHVQRGLAVAAKRIFTKTAVTAARYTEAKPENSLVQPEKRVLTLNRQRQIYTQVFSILGMKGSYSNVLSGYKIPKRQDSPTSSSDVVFKSPLPCLDDPILPDLVTTSMVADSADDTGYESCESVELRCFSPALSAVSLGAESSTTPEGCGGIASSSEEEDLDVLVIGIEDEDYEFLARLEELPRYPQSSTSYQDITTTG